jgi:hypothetical protein
VFAIASPCVGRNNHKQYRNLAVYSAWRSRLIATPGCENGQRGRDKREDRLMPSPQSCED